MNLIIIHEVGYLSKPVYEYQDFAERLAYQGHNVTVFDFDESIVKPFTVTKVSKTGLASVNLVSLPNHGISVIKILYARYRFQQVFRKFLRSNRIDAVFLYSVFVNGIDAVKICHELGVRIIFRAIDAYHRLRKNRLQSWLLKQGEIFIYKNVDLIAATNLNMCQYVRELAGTQCSSVCILDHGVDTAHFKKLEFDDALANRLGISQSDLVVVFLGTTYSFSQLDLLIAQLPQMRRFLPNIKLVIIGSGELDESIAAQIQSFELQQHVICCGLIDYSSLPRYLSLAKLAILPFQINTITRDIIPIKLLQYLSSSLPVISTPLPDVVNHFPEMSSGVVYSADDSISAFANALQICVQSKNIDALSSQARDFVSQHYSMDAATKHLIKILSNAH